VEEEAARWETVGDVGRWEGFEKQTEGVDTVDRDGSVEGNGEIELGFEDSELFVERSAAEAGEAHVVGPGAFEHPAVEADFADGGVGIGGEVSAECFEPGGSAVADIPRVEAVAGEEAEGGPRAESGELRAGDGAGDGDETGVGGAERGDFGPVGFFGAVDDGVGDAGGGVVGENLGAVGSERGRREVVVSVVIHQAAVARTEEELTTKHPKYTKGGGNQREALGIHGRYGKRRRKVKGRRRILKP
jgi:hypothetical protein